jgi:dTDP-glucose 4,6-dehydratase
MRKKLHKIRVCPESLRKRDCPRRGLSLKLLVTGGAGFIGSEFVRQAVRRGLSLIVVDKLTYAGDLRRLNEVKGKYKFYKADICNQKQIGSIFKKEKPEAVVSFAAETHVDRSIQDASPFIETNIKGTQALLDISRKYKIKKFIQISTDEVYGEIAHGEFNENSLIKPNSPYAASKAAADLLVRSYIRTYNFPAIIIRPCNNYGPWQYPEKLIPLAILKILKGGKVPVYAKGKNVREWLYVEDCARGILKVLEKGRLGEIYNIGSNQEKQNIQVVRGLLKILNADETRINFVKDRPGHDIRYKLNWRKIAKETGWKPLVGFSDGIRETVNWYISNLSWLEAKGG